MKHRSILFISHEANRTGAPFVLLNFQRWLKAKTDFKVTTVARRNGPLVAEFAKLGDTIVMDSGFTWCPDRMRGVTRRLGWDRLHRWRCARSLRSRPFDLVYSNTVTNGKLLADVVRPGTPVLTHAHELSYWIERSGAENWDLVRRYTNRFVAVSEAVSRNLIEKYQISASQISVVHEFIPVGQNSGVLTAERKAQMRRNLGISPDAFVVGGSGMETWRKGKDLFVQLAAEVRRRRPQRPFYFIWVGWPGDDEDQRQLAHDSTAAELTECIRWTGEIDNPSDYFACIDAFALVSREDPFPLVCLEAGLLGAPILCFDNAGGIPELVQQDSGFVVDYLDVGAMADKLHLLAQDEALRLRLGSSIADKVRSRFTVDANAPRLLAIIENMLGAGSHATVSP